MKWIIGITAVLAISACVTAAEKVDATGTWEWSYKRSDGGSATVAVKLKQDQEKLTGVFVDRGGAEVPIANGRIDGEGSLSFDVTRQIDGKDRLFKYRGKLAGDTITGKIDFVKDGKITPHDWEARRKK